jgi:hypothetical protein
MLDKRYIEYYKHEHNNKRTSRNGHVPNAGEWQEGYNQRME